MSRPVRSTRKATYVGRLCDDEEYEDEEESPSRRHKRTALPGGGRTTAPATAKTQKLTDLTKQFVQQLQDAPGGVVDLNDVATSLQVAKRRVYDITNVLEGVGVIRKEGKNNVKWCPGEDEDHGGIDEQRQLEADIAELTAAHAHLEGQSRKLTDQLVELLQQPALRPHLYVTAEDLASLDTSNSTYIALRCANLQVLNEHDELVADPGAVQEGHQQLRVRALGGGNPVDLWIVRAPVEQGADEAGAVPAAGPDPLAQPSTAMTVTHAAAGATSIQEHHAIPSNELLLPQGFNSPTGGALSMPLVGLTPSPLGGLARSAPPSLPDEDLWGKLDAPLGGAVDGVPVLGYGPSEMFD